MGSRPSLSSMGCDHSRPRNVLEQTSFLISSSEQTLLPLPLVVLHLYHQRMLTATLLYLKEGSDRVSKQKERASAWSSGQIRSKFTVLCLCHDGAFSSPAWNVQVTTGSTHTAGWYSRTKGWSINWVAVGRDLGSCRKHRSKKSFPSSDKLSGISGSYVSLLILNIAATCKIRLEKKTQHHS